MGKRPFTKGKQSKEKDKDQLLICYECKKPGHFKSECPQLKKDPKKYKKKAMMLHEAEVMSQVSKKKTQINKPTCVLWHMKMR